MEIFVKMNPSVHSFRNFYDFVSVFRIGYGIRDMYFPIRKGTLDSLKPFS